MMLLNLLLRPWFYITFTASSIWFFISSEPDSVFSSLTTPVAASTLAVLISTIARRLTPQPIKLRADIELTCYTPAGIDAIKKALRSGEKQSNEAVPIKAKLVAPPLYVLSTNSTDKVYIFEKKICISTLLTIDLKQYVAVERLERAIESIQSTIESQGGSLIVKMKVMFLLYQDFSSTLPYIVFLAQGCFGDGRARSSAAHDESWAGKCWSFRRREWWRRVIRVFHFYNAQKSIKFS